MQIKRASPAEAARLTEIALLAKRHWGYPEQWLRIWREQLTVTPEIIRSHETFSAAADGQAIGFYALGRKGDNPELAHMWVLPEWIGRGVGRALFLHAVERAKALGFRKIEIESDPNAEGFYLRMGARRVGVNVQIVEQQRRELPTLLYQID
jgi:GNAT superfamily N-acetyltransferase